jgi:tetratricopeptide (TPR) repeat protein
MVTYPNRPGNEKPSRPNFGGGDRPSLADRDRPDKDRFNLDRSKINNVHIDKININRQNIALNRPGSRKPDWDNSKWGGNKSVWGNRVNIGNNVNINIDNHFRISNNFSYRPNYWGANPWWGASHCHSWHHGHWNYGWNSSYYRRHWWYEDDSFARGFMWGIGVWSLGNLIYDMGYHSYRNPYPAPRVENTYITYAQPVSVAAAANPPGENSSAELAEAKSDEALDRSRSSFKQGDYLSASKSVDEAIAHTPGDVTLHEYRSLVFFALGKYADAAGVLNPVLASGPGWSWETMIEFYNSSETYGEQLRRLESFVSNAPDKADARFLLGYHYMVCGHMEKSYEQFAKATELQPADSISRQLRDLTKSSIPDGGESEIEPPVRPEPVPLDQLAGTWVSDRGQDGKVTFIMTEAGDYTWTFMNGESSSELKGTYGLNDKGLLVLTSEDTQMVSIIELKEGSKLHFTLVGAPDGDPGLDFARM